MKWQHILAWYLAAGFTLSLMMGSAIPAISVLGHLYITLTWPVWPFEHLTGLNFMPIPAWCFSFS